MTSETVACPSCGQQVDNPLAHEGYSCASWPNEVDAAGYAYYRDYTICRSEGFTPLDWEWVHKDYDGHEDNRAGHAYSIHSCCMSIDEMEDF